MLAGRGCKHATATGHTTQPHDIGYLGRQRADVGGFFLPIAWRRIPPWDCVAVLVWERNRFSCRGVLGLLWSCVLGEIYHQRFRLSKTSLIRGLHTYMLLFTPPHRRLPAGLGLSFVATDLQLLNMLPCYVKRRDASNRNLSRAHRGELCPLL